VSPTHSFFALPVERFEIPCGPTVIMVWITPSEKDIATKTLEKRLRDNRYDDPHDATGRATCCCRVCCRVRSTSQRTEP
jgi:hypothetical protein